ncbi:hypothetical protein AB4114_04840 [Paenibacillus sp. 2RAB27]|uniref:hypothetical protein n=1 Tax=Paenibacillus sp. 2RAB27 TaxID=3232991 RepID=UPI003F94C54B
MKQWMKGIGFAVMFVVVVGCTMLDDEPPTGENIARHTELPKTTASAYLLYGYV